MIEAIATMFFMGIGFGTLLGIASKRFQVETNPILDELEEIMPGTNCGQCGYPGCRAAIEAVVGGEAPVTLCPPGGAELATELAERLRIEADLGDVAARNPLVAFIFEDQCVGCTKCFKRCPTDAIVGASRQMHTVINDACIGCKACVDACPTNAIIVRALPDNLQTWHWPKPSDVSLVPEPKQAVLQ